MGRAPTAGRSVALFAQARIGEWRVGAVMFPNAVSDSEIAEQAGAGFELRLRHAAARGGTRHTMLHRDLHRAPHS